jgi:hypothetical protein
VKYDDEPAAVRLRMDAVVQDRQWFAILVVKYFLLVACWTVYSQAEIK